MKQLSIKLTDAEHEKLEMLRGNNSKSDYIRMLLSAHDKEVRNENADFHKLFKDVKLVRESLQNLPNKNHLLALATYMAEVASIANPPAYANYKDELSHLFQTFQSQMRSEE